jgi:hypothetical protein
VLASFYEKVGERWEVCVSLTEGQFQQVIENLSEWIVVYFQAVCNCITVKFLYPE